MIEILTVVEETKILGRNVHIYRDVENPLFEANEVAEWLGIQNVSQMLKQADIDESEKDIFLKYTLGGNQKTLFITEDAMYEILMRSRKKEAKPFIISATIPKGQHPTMHINKRTIPCNSIT